MKKLFNLSVLMVLFFSMRSLAVNNYNSVKMWGSGCSPNSAQSIIYSPDNKAVSILFGPETTLTKKKFVSGDPQSISMNCNVQANYQAKYDIQYVVLSSDWRGFASLVPQSSASTKIDTWLSYKDLNGNLVNTPTVTHNSTLTGPFNDTTFFSSLTPDILTSTECGQSFDLNMKMNTSLMNTNPTQDAQIGFDSLDLAQVREVACANPWKAEFKNIIGDSITVKVTTEPSKVNKLGSLYVVAFYQGKYYAWTPGKSSPWTELAADFSTGIPALATGNAPQNFEIQIGNIDSSAKSAIVYVGVGYGNDDASRLNDMLSTQRYNVVYTVQ